MKRFASQIKKQSETIKLSALERDDLRERLQSYMEYHPLPHTATKKKATESIVAEPYRLISIPKLYIRAAAGVFALLLVVGVPMVAERAVPGDALYFVKVQFNEEVRSTLALSPYEKVEWEAERLTRRISEARLLASEGKLTDEFESEVAEAVRAHSDAAQKEIAALREDDAEEAAIAEIVFASTLDVQSAVLRSDSDKASTTKSESSAIADVVEEKRREANQNQVVSEEVPSIERLHARVEIETTRAYELLESVQEYATEQETIDITRRLADIERKLERVLVAADELEDKEARMLLREVLQGTTKLISFMTDIDVRETVVIEALVPVELTPEEYAVLVDEKLQYVASVMAVATETIDDVAAPDIAEKVTGNLLELARLSEVASSSIATSSYSAALTAATEAEALAGDMVILLNITLNETGAVEEVPDIIEESNNSTSSEPVIEETGSSTEEIEITEEPLEEPIATSTEALGSTTVASATTEI